MLMPHILFRSAAFASDRSVPTYSINRCFMPTLFRFLVILATIAGVIYGIMYSLANFVEPRQRDITVRIPSDHLNLPEQ